MIILNNTQMVQYSDLCQLCTEWEMRVDRIGTDTLYFYVERQEFTVDTDCSQQLQSTKMLNSYHPGHFKDELCDVVV